MTKRNEMIEKILRPNGGDLLIPHEKQIEACGLGWVDMYKDCLNSCNFCFHTKKGARRVDSRTDPESYLRALLQPIPNFSTAMQFLEKGAVLFSTEWEYPIKKHLVALSVLTALRPFSTSKRWVELFHTEDTYYHSLTFLNFLREMVEGRAKFIYTPWVGRETGETDQAVKDLCDDILGD